MKVKVSELSGRALNWAVAFVEWSEPSAVVNGETFWWDHKDGSFSHFVKSKGHADSSEYQPSKNWAHGGPKLAEREVSVFPCRFGWKACIGANMLDDDDHLDGRTYLEAGMRAVIVSWIGGNGNTEIEIPDELCEVTP